MQSEITDIFAKEVFTTKKKPFYFYLTISLWLILFVLFITVVKIRELDKDSIISTALIFIFFAIYNYLIFGRYLASITFYNHKIEINYLLPWNKEVQFRFNQLTEIDFKEFDLVDRLTRSWYRGGKWLYLKNEIGEVCQFKYTINTIENERLLEELQKRCNSDIAYS